MSMRVMFAIIVLSSSGMAQSSAPASSAETTDAATGYSDADRKAPAEYVFEIRVLPANEVIQQFIKNPVQQFEADEAAPPFAGAVPLAADQTPVLRSAETRISRTDSIAVIELSHEQFLRCLSAGHDERGSNIVFAPKVTTLEGQTGMISDISRVLCDGKKSLPTSNELALTRIEGTEIFVRAGHNEFGAIQADVDVRLHRLTNGTDVSGRASLLPDQAPQSGMTSLSVSGILKGPILHMAIVPQRIHVSGINQNQVDRVSWLPGRKKSKEPQPTSLVWLISVSANE